MKNYFTNRFNWTAFFAFGFICYIGAFGNESIHTIKDNFTFGTICVFLIALPIAILTSEPKNK